MTTSDVDLESDWADLRPPGSNLIQIARNDLPGLMAMALAQTQHDLLMYLQKRPGSETMTPEALSEFVATGVQLFWDHLTKGARGVDTIGLIEIILSAQGIPATELKIFMRGLPRTLLNRILESALGAQAEGIHALLALEVLVRDGRENDYTLTQLPSGGIEVTVRARAHDNKVLSFRLNEEFCPPNPPQEAPGEETKNATGPLPHGEPEAPRHRSHAPDPRLLRRRGVGRDLRRGGPEIVSDGHGSTCGPCPGLRPATHRAV